MGEHPFPATCASSFPLECDRIFIYRTLYRGSIFIIFKSWAISLVPFVPFVPCLLSDSFTWSFSQSCGTKCLFLLVLWDKFEWLWKWFSVPSKRLFKKSFLAVGQKGQMGQAIFCIFILPTFCWWTHNIGNGQSKANILFDKVSLTDQVVTIRLEWAFLSLSETLSLNKSHSWNIQVKHRNKVWSRTLFESLPGWSF